MKHLLWALLLFVSTFSSASTLTLQGQIRTLFAEDVQQGFSVGVNFDFVSNRVYVRGDVIELYVLSPGLSVKDVLSNSQIEFLDFLSGDTLRVRFLILEDVSAYEPIPLSLTLFCEETCSTADIYASAAATISTIVGPLTLDISNEVLVLDAVGDVLTLSDTFLVSPAAGKIDSVDLNSDVVVKGEFQLSAPLFKRFSSQIPPLSLNKNVRYVLHGEFAGLMADEGNVLREGIDVQLAVNAVPLTLENLQVTDRQITFSARHLLERVFSISITGTSADFVPQTLSMDVEIELTLGGTTRWVNAVSQQSIGQIDYIGEAYRLTNLPFGRDFSQLITVTNTNLRSLSIDAVIRGEFGEKFVVEGIGMVEADAVANISQAIRSAVADTGLSGVVNIDLIMDTQKENVTVDALYYSKSDGDRVALTVH